MVFLSIVIIPFQFLCKPNRQIPIPLTDYISFLSTKYLVKPDNIPFQFLPDSNSFDRFHSFINHSANQTPHKSSSLILDFEDEILFYKQRDIITELLYQTLSEQLVLGVSHYFIFLYIQHIDLNLTNFVKRVLDGLNIDK